MTTPWREVETIGGIDVIVSDRCPKGMIYVGTLDLDDPESTVVIVDDGHLFRFRIYNAVVWEDAKLRLDELAASIERGYLHASADLARVNARLLGLGELR